MFHSSWIELDAAALKKNIRFLKKWIGSDVKFSSVVKGNAYGHGIDAFVPLAESCGIRHFSVFSAYEALEVLNSRTQDSEIMIMGTIDIDELEWAIRNNISFYIFDLDRLEAAKCVAKKQKKPARIHLELETGLNRMGLSNESLNKAVQMIKDNGNKLRLEGICTHFAGAESISNYVRIKRQIELYNEMLDWIRHQGIDPVVRHTACSAAALNYPETIMDMVRFGIAHYGYWPTQETKIHYQLEQGGGRTEHFKDPLKRVISWKSRIMNVKVVEPGEFVGYGTSYQTNRRQKIASIPVGYHHGFARSLSNLGQVLVRGRRVAVVGVVNMNMLMADVTDVKDVKTGDEVVIIGTQKHQSISVASFSEMTRYLNYEILVRLHSSIPRVVVNESN